MCRWTLLIAENGSISDEIFPLLTRTQTVGGGGGGGGGGGLAYNDKETRRLVLVARYFSEPPINSDLHPAVAVLSVLGSACVDRQRAGLYFWFS